MFQSTHPQGVRRIWPRSPCRYCSVSIHAPAGGATDIDLSGLEEEDVSIHAPAGGATHQVAHVIQGANVSIHAPAGGATSLGSTMTLLSMSFNPRTRMGCDSTRVPLQTGMLRFNPRTRRGCDNVEAAMYAIYSKFQSTHPQGVRRLKIAYSPPAPSCFNPRTRRGCDQPPHLQRPCQCRFNPRTRRGCDSDSAKWMFIVLKVSIHAPAGGATLAIEF